MVPVLGSLRGHLLRWVVVGARACPALSDRGPSAGMSSSGPVLSSRCRRWLPRRRRRCLLPPLSWCTPFVLVVVVTRGGVVVVVVVVVAAVDGVELLRPVPDMWVRAQGDSRAALEVRTPRSFHESWLSHITHGTTVVATQTALQVRNSWTWSCCSAHRV